MKKFIITALMLALCITLAVPALAEGVRDANAAYNELLAGFNGGHRRKAWRGAGQNACAHKRGLPRRRKIQNGEVFL